MRLLVVLLLLACQSVVAVPRIQFPLNPFWWKGKVVSDLEQLYQSMRKIGNWRTAGQFREALQSKNENAEFFLGYALGEFEVPDERVRAARLFQIEHPILGSIQEMPRLSTMARVFLGFLVGFGFNREQVAEVR